MASPKGHLGRSGDFRAGSDQNGTRDFDNPFVRTHSGTWRHRFGRSFRYQETNCGEIPILHFQELRALKSGRAKLPPILTKSFNKHARTIILMICAVKSVLG